MEIGTVFTLDEYSEAYEFATENSCTIEEIEAKGDERQFKIVEIPEPTVDELQAEARAVRNSYLEKYVDPKQLVMVWDSLSVDERNTYADYRKYLLDYTNSDEWWLSNPMTLDEWLLVGFDEITEEEV